MTNDPQFVTLPLGLEWILQRAQAYHHHTVVSVVIQMILLHSLLWTFQTVQAYHHHILVTVYLFTDCCHID